MNVSMSNVVNLSVMMETPEYRAWIAELKNRYRSTQIKASMSVNAALLEYYLNLGRDIEERYSEAASYAEFYRRLSGDLRITMPEVGGHSPVNLKYCNYFYRLYKDKLSGQQVADFAKISGQQLVDFQNGRINLVFSPVMLLMIPWGHHLLIIDKCGGDVEKAIFYVRETIRNGWSRAVLQTWIASDLFAREGKALTNFTCTLPAPHGDLAQQLTKDPYIFEVQGLKKDYDERQLKLAMVANIERVLLEIGRGFAFVGREYPMMIGGQEKRADLLFYLIPQHRYFVVEVKMGEFEPADLGQLEGYLASCDLELNGEGDNPAFGLVVCKGRNETLVRYMLGKTNMPIGVSEYELLRCLPEEFKSDMPTTDELESEFNLADEHSSRSGYDVAKGSDAPTEKLV